MNTDIDTHTTYEALGGLIPANGWRAVYADRHDVYPDDVAETGTEIFIRIDPLVAFAATRETTIYPNGEKHISNWARVIGYANYAGKIVPVEISDDFIDYLPPNESVSAWVKQRAREYVEAHELAVLAKE